MKTINDTETKQVKNPQNYHVAEIVKELNVDTKSGLYLQKVSENQKKFGLNEIETIKKVSFFIRLIHQFKEPMIIILLIAAIISFIPLVIYIIHGDFVKPAD